MSFGSITVLFFIYFYNKFENWSIVFLCIFRFLFYVFECFACLYISTWYIGLVRREIACSGIGITDGCEPPCGDLKFNLVSERADNAFNCWCISLVLFLIPLLLIKFYFSFQLTQYPFSGFQLMFFNCIQFWILESEEVWFLKQLSLLRWKYSKYSPILSLSLWHYLAIEHRNVFVLWLRLFIDQHFLIPLFSSVAISHLLQIIIAYILVMPYYRLSL